MENQCKFLPKNALQSMQGNIQYEIYPTTLGPLLIAVWEDSICYVGYTDSTEELFAAFSHASVSFQKAPHMLHQKALGSILVGGEAPPCVVFATSFEQAVLHSLCGVPRGSVLSYAQLAQQAGYSKAVRAVGTAIGKNKISVLIPCHRVIRGDGTLGEYHWGKHIKKALLAHEGVHV